MKIKKIKPIIHVGKPNKYALKPLFISAGISSDEKYPAKQTPINDVINIDFDNNFIFHWFSLSSIDNIKRTKNITKPK